MERRTFLLAGAALATPLIGACRSEPPVTGVEIRCAVIGGMMITNFFPEAVKRFERDTHNVAKVVISGNKRTIAPAMEAGEVDLITMHASDVMTNLVADGYAMDSHPWARNDHVIVGPKDDPAGVRGLRDGALAMKKLIEAKADFVQHRAGGANEVLRALLDAAGVSLDDTHTLRLKDGDNQESVLEFAATKHAYSLVGFIPFKTGKMQGPGLDVLVEGDSRMRRPYEVAIANPKRWPAARYQGAKLLSDYLRSEATQAWIAEFGRGEFGGHPPFSPITT